MANKKQGLWDTVREAIDNSRTLTLKTITYLPRERTHIDTVLGAFLDAAGMRELKNNLSYCVHELAGNAKKANTKRLYFRENHLDITNEIDYARGMKGFKGEMIDRVGYYLDMLREEDLYVKFQFRKLRGGVRVSVRNNVELTPAEQRRIDDKMAIARRYACLADAYTTTEDGAEGAGLGLVMMMFMLKNLGFGPDAFGIKTAGGETVATMTLITPPVATPHEESTSASA